MGGVFTGGGASSAGGGDDVNNGCSNGVGFARAARSAAIPAKKICHQGVALSGGSRGVNGVAGGVLTGVESSGEDGGQRSSGARSKMLQWLRVVEGGRGEAVVGFP